jgi:P2-related tail formation protein
MTTANHLLQRESTALERAIAFAISDVLPVPYRQILDPDTAPEAWLPFLAANESVDLWFNDWSVARKRLMIKQAAFLAQIVGTRVAAERFLAFVDTQVIHKVSHPARRPVGQIAAGIHPIAHLDYTARFLLKVDLHAHKRSICVGRSAIGRSAVLGVNLEPLRRAKLALTLSKAPESAYSVVFSHRVPRTLDDGLNLAQGIPIESFKDRIRL